MQKSKLHFVKERFSVEIGKPDLMLKVPGRANIIGEHIDYCGGRVLPFAIEQSMYFVSKKRSDNNISVNALDVDEQESFKVREYKQWTGWRSFFAQAIDIISSNYDIGGLDLYFASDIPAGAGVSSSSALCSGIITTIDHLYNLGLSKNEMVNIASQAEHGIGVLGGIMDQYAILLGEPNYALLIDCHTATHSLIDLSDNPYHWVLLNTNIKHDLANTPYNKRRDQVEEALAIINQKTQSNKNFREITASDIALLSNKPILQKRISHVYNEIVRVKQTVSYISDKNYIEIGRILNQSHQSLSDDYEVSCPELDFVCQELEKDQHVLGCRMMGGGFGGSVIALVKPNFISQSVKENYNKAYGIELDVMSVSPSKGVQVI